jgi:hypothetical protein
MVFWTILVAGRQGRGREINECYSKTKETGVGKCYLETRGGSPTPEVKTASAITCDYIWDKLYPHHHFCNLL